MVMMWCDDDNDDGDCDDDYSGGDDKNVYDKVWP